MEPTASQAIKRLHSKNVSDGSSLKDYAIHLAQNGSADERKLVRAWLDNKAGPKRPEKPAPAPAPSNAPVLKKAPPPRKK